MSESNIYSNLKTALTNVIKEFWNNPFNYFYEEDVRAELYYKIKRSIDRSASYGIDKQFSELQKQKGKITTSIVKAEYPYSNCSRRFDIAILEENEHKTFYKVPARIGIEIKLGSEETKIFNDIGFYKNIKSLIEYKESQEAKTFMGLSLFFYQTKLDDLARYFINFNFSDPIDLEKLDFTENVVYGLLICGDQKLFRVTSFLKEEKLIL